MLLRALLCSAILALVSSTISPLVIPPSLYWDGDDGRWSTFFVNIGTPAQTLRLLPGTSAEAGTVFYAVIPIGCDIVNPTLPGCAEKRGGLFYSNRSTSWSTETLANQADGAIYNLGLVEEGALGIAGNGSYGFDTVSLGLNNGLPTFQAVIAGIWTDAFFVGVLPLSPWPANFSFNTPIASPLGLLRNTSQVPSLSYGYTAGAYYQDSRLSRFGSLVLGGYDTSRFVENGVSFPFGPDISRDLLLKLDSISYDSVGSSPLMTTSINIFIDSLVSEMWLPVSVCEGFKKAFNLTYNSPYYLVDSTVHTALLKQNPKFSFKLSNGTSSVTITLPYAAFDLNLTLPIVGDTTGYFPIRQAQNESQYVLGRTFLQEAYLVVDYERRTFGVNQEVFPSTSVSSNVVAIEVVPNGTAKSLSAGAIAGIVVGSVVVVSLIAVLIWWCRKKPRTHEPEMMVDLKVMHEPEPTELDTTGGRAELASKLAFWKGSTRRQEHRHELLGSEAAQELRGSGGAHELDAGKSAHEMSTVPRSINREPVELPS